jgi:hypothetical protein
MKVPKNLRIWFKIHFLVDLLFAIPLFLIPDQFLIIFGIVVLDPLFARLVAAALFGIGGASWLMRKSNVETYFAMLWLKLIWSSFAIIALGISLTLGGPWPVWIIFSTFVVFWLAWVYYLKLLRA